MNTKIEIPTTSLTVKPTVSVIPSLKSCNIVHINLDNDNDILIFTQGGKTFQLDSCCIHAGPENKHGADQWLTIECENLALEHAQEIFRGLTGLTI